MHFFFSKWEFHTIDTADTVLYTKTESRWPAKTFDYCEIRTIQVNEAIYTFETPFDWNDGLKVSYCTFIDKDFKSKTEIARYHVLKYKLTLALDSRRHQVYLSGGNV